MYIQNKHTHKHIIHTIPAYGKKNKSNDEHKRMQNSRAQPYTRIKRMLNDTFLSIGFEINGIRCREYKLGEMDNISTLGLNSALHEYRSSTDSRNKLATTTNIYI